VIGGLLGVGGSIGFIPLATIFLAPDKQQLQGAAMVANFVVALTAWRRYRRAGTVDWALARRIVPAALVAVLAGVATSLFVEAPAFRVLFAAFLFAIAAREFVLLARGAPDGNGSERDLRAPLPAVVGTVMGYLSGLLGIGGGVVGIPLMRAWGKLEMKRAVVTSVCTMVPLTAMGATTKAITLARTPLDGGGNALVPALAIAACLVPTAVAGSWLGATINLRITGRAVRWALTTYLPIAAGWMAWPVLQQWLAGPK
jgi:uncharacterized membrane protein YfcA